MDRTSDPARGIRSGDRSAGTRAGPGTDRGGDGIGVRVTGPPTGGGVAATSLLAHRVMRHRGTLGVPGLVLIGVGGIIGAGFFLGSGLPIHTAGPAVLIAFLLGAVVTAQVTGALASVAVHDSAQGSFVAYAHTYIGRYAGFLQGWSYYLSSVITVASEAVAMAIYSHLWLPRVPTWMMAVVYIAVVVAINAFGVRNFGLVESVMSVLKIGALVGFIIFLGYLLIAGAAGVAPAYARSSAHGASAIAMTGGAGGFFPHGWTGVFQSMLIVIFSFAGIGVFATATPEMRRPSDINRAAWYTVGMLTVLYLLSIGLLLFVVPWQTAGTHESPFVAALHRTRVPVLAQVLNGIILIASFSVMAGAVFSSNQILHGLGQNRDAPRFVMRMAGGRVPLGALSVTAGGIALVMVVAYTLPSNVYDFLISASSFLTFLTYLLILWSFLAWRRRSKGERPRMSSLAFGQPWTSAATMLFILFMTAYALQQHDQRFGFYAAAVLIVVISLTYWFLSRRRGRAPG